MAVLTKDVIELGMQLPPDEREKLANLLLDSLENVEAEDRELQEEIQRRWDRYENGEEPAIPIDDFLSELQQRINSRRSETIAVE